MSDDNRLSLETRLAQACHYVDAVTGGISPPLQFSSTYARNEDYEFVGRHSYSRSGNPSWEVLERVCADLDNGHEALCFASWPLSRSAQTRSSTSQEGLPLRL